MEMFFCFFCFRVDFIYAHSEGEGKLYGHRKDLLMIDSCMAFSLSGTLLCNSNVRWKGKNTEEGMFLEGRQPSHI